METDWQINFTKIKDRNQYLLHSEKLADCRFLVSTSSNQSLIAGHRLLLAMASPVFERMFYGSLPEKDDPILLPDAERKAFAAMLDYIYTDEISISSFNNACDLYYLAKKYMLPHVVEYCTNFLLADLSPKNACRAYEFGKLHEEPRLIESSMKHIAFNTQQVIADPSFMDIEVSTLMAILDQERLNIDSELDLFNCLLKLANEHGLLTDGEKDNKTDADSKKASNVVKKIKLELETVSTLAETCGRVPSVDDEFVVVDSDASGNPNSSENANDVVVEEIKLKSEDSNSGVSSLSAGTCGNVPNVSDEVVQVINSVSTSANAGESKADINNLMEAQRNTIDEAILRQAVKKIRFLSMTPQQFAEGPARSKLLKQNEIIAIFIKGLSPTINDCPMPEGFCQSIKRDSADNDHMKRYCVSAPIKSNIYNRQFFNIFQIDNCLKFRVNRNIYLLGVQIKSQSSYRVNIIESFSACIENMKGSVIATSSSIANKNDSMYEFTFKSPVFIYQHQKYNIKINNMHGYNFLMSTWDREMLFEGVKFSIYPVYAFKEDLDSTISGIVFSTQQELSRNLIK